MMAEAEACRDLWIAVIELALADVNSKPAGKLVSLTDDDGEVIDSRADALEWFTDAGEDFRFVCDMAGIDPEHVRRLALEPGYFERTKARALAQPNRVNMTLSIEETMRLNALAPKAPPFNPRTRRRPTLTAEERRERQREAQRRYKERKGAGEGRTPGRRLPLANLSPEERAERRRQQNREAAARYYARKKSNSE